MAITINAKAGSAEITLFGEIGPDAAADFDARLKALGAVKTILLHIHSPGGNLIASMSIFNSLQRHPARVVAFIDGIAASAASFVAMAADDVRIAENSVIMIHLPTTGTAGDATEMRRTAGLLDQLRDGMVDAGLSRVRVIAMMEAETWLDAREALDLGFADFIDGPVAVAEAFDLSKFQHPPKVAATIAELSRQFWAAKGKSPAAPRAASVATPVPAVRGSIAPDLVVQTLDVAQIWGRRNAIGGTISRMKISPDGGVL